MLRVPTLDLSLGYELDISVGEGLLAQRPIIEKSDSNSDFRWGGIRESPINEIFSCNTTEAIEESTQLFDTTIWTVSDRVESGDQTRDDSSRRIDYSKFYDVADAKYVALSLLVDLVPDLSLILISAPRATN